MTFIELVDKGTKFFESMGVSEDIATHLFQILAYVVLILFSFVAYRITEFLLKRVIIPLVRRSKTHFDDLLIKNRFFIRMAFLMPALIIYYSVESDLFIHENISNFVKDLSVIFFYVIGALIFESLLSTVNDYYKRFHVAKDHPINGIIQVLKIVIYLIVLLGIFGYIFNKNITTVLLGLGTLSAVLMLIFKDPILGFVGGLQLIFNKMIAIGDWITMPKYGADGNVLEINLTTVKVQNFDKTIITIPTYSLISDSFQNWRGMSESGGRRIKRAINIDMDSIKFCDKEMLKKFEKIKIIKEYINRKEKEIAEYNAAEEIDPSILVNGRRQTNLGVFRAYLKAYLMKRTDINNDMTFLVRHLDPTEKGIPVQIYVFTTTTDWGQYEDIQADIFDHILAVIPEFELRVFQFPSNAEIFKLISGKPIN
ncbi:MAG: mechanosensitive ion channel [Bacteroidetes bacterium]|nr:mechanosensitive ion channel [Bacteroidota bacterium]MBL6943868.1 mechanosensitive ion channel [Bacteroidales bacterium]